MPSGGANKGKGKGATWVFENVAHRGDDCLIYPYSKVVDGYGQFGFMGRMVRAHVFMCQLAHGLPPTLEHEVAHTCGNGHLGCCNPRHLEWKTRSENQRDRYKKERRPKRYRFKLNADQVREIRRLKGTTTQQALADKFGVSRTNIIMIHSGQTWPDVS